MNINKIIEELVTLLYLIRCFNFFVIAKKKQYLNNFDILIPEKVFVKQSNVH